MCPPVTGEHHEQHPHPRQHHHQYPEPSASFCEHQEARDSAGRYCLNYLHKAAGGDPKHKVPNWLRLDSTHDLIDEIARVSDVRLAPASSVHGGANQGTYVCKELVYAYAMWLAQAGVQPLGTSESHPTRIRMWFAEHWAVVGTSDNEVTH